MGLIQKLFGSKNQRELNKLQPLVERVNQLEKTFKAKSDTELKAMTAEFKQKLDNGATLDDLLPEAFAATREASVRTTGMRHYDVADRDRKRFTVTEKGRVLVTAEMLEQLDR